MCGICGIIHDDPERPVDRGVLEAMNRTMTHRGPDDKGFFYGRGSGLAMRRLSIIDVEGGHQPLLSEDGRVVAICNGELYNFKELRRELESRGHLFRTRSDAEILPHLYEERGAGLVDPVNGMFGLAVWDEKERSLVLARDRMGEKPLYYARAGKSFLFGSELKAILAHPEVVRRIDRSSLAKYLAHDYVPAPHTIIEGVAKLEPGQLLVWRAGRLEKKNYWDLPRAAEAYVGEEEAASELLRLLEKSVAIRLASDVPLGVFLSGGIDSSSVLAMMARVRRPEEIKTFSISFAEKSFDESSWARRVAAHFGTEHRERMCTPAELLKLMPKVAELLDEPFADASIIPTYALAKFTREHVTVALGGDGGDELFAGYPTFQAERAAGLYAALPSFVRRGFIDRIVGLLPVSDENISFDFKVRRFIKGAAVPGPARHIVWLGAFSPAEQRDLFAVDPPGGVFEDAARHWESGAGFSRGNRLLYTYKKLYLAEDILTKVDRATMGVSLESRAPFLDHELVEFVAKLPYRMKLKGFTMKHLLKKAVGPLLPEGVAGRAKKGFGVPVAKWVKGPIREMVLDCLSVDRIKREGIFRAGAVSGIIKDHMSGRENSAKKIWSLLMFERWLERWGS